MIAAFAILYLAGFSQDSKSQSSKKKKTLSEKVKYTCPVHPEETSDKPGKCPKCKMDLKEIKQESKVYSCPMHPEEISNKPGKCSKCNMDLLEKKDDHSGHQH